MPLGQSFLFKVIGRELAAAAVERLRAYKCIDERLVSSLLFQVGSRILNGDECLSAFAKPYDVVHIIRPNGARAKSLLKEVK